MKVWNSEFTFSLARSELEQATCRHTDEQINVSPLVLWAALPVVYRGIQCNTGKAWRSSGQRLLQREE